MEPDKRHDALNSASIKFLFILIISLLCFNNITAQDLIASNFPDESEPVSKSIPHEQIEFNSLTGDWWGTRTKLFKSGYEFSFSMKNELFSSFTKESSGMDYLNLFDFNASMDLNELWGFSDASLFVQVLGINGTAPESRSGALQGVSNIASPRQWRLYQFWIEKKFADNSISLLAGLFDLNSEFDVRSTSSLFINPSWGIGADFAFSGSNGPSIFPSTSFAVRMNFDVTEQLTFKVGIFDAVPGNHDEDYLTHIFNHRDDGVLLVGEAGFSNGPEEVCSGFAKYSIGFWYYPQAYDDMSEVDHSGNPVKHFGNSGLYLNAEKFICTKPGSTELGLSVFGRLGFANKNLNAVQTFWGFGFNLSGAFSNDPEESFGFAIANARLSGKFVAANSLNLANPRFNETVLELTYAFNLLKWLRVQPDLQYIVNPAEGAAQRALIVGARIELRL